MDKNYKQNKAAKAKAEEAALNRILCWLVGGTAVEVFALLLDRFWIHWRGTDEVHLRLALDLPVKILAFVALAGAVALGWWLVNTLRSKGNPNLPGTLCGVSLGISLSCFGAWLSSDTGNALNLVRLGVLILVVLAVIFYLYQREFFLVACQSGVAILGIWLCSKGLVSSKAIVCYLYVILGVALMAASAVLCRKLQQNGGVLDWNERKMRIFPKDANYILLYAGAAVSLVTLVCSLLAVPVMALYALAAAWVLVMAVYYTVKLM